MDSDWTSTSQKTDSNALLPLCSKCFPALGSIWVLCPSITKEALAILLAKGPGLEPKKAISVHIAVQVGISQHDVGGLALLIRYKKCHKLCSIVCELQLCPILISNADELRQRRVAEGCSTYLSLLHFNEIMIKNASNAIYIE